MWSGKKTEQPKGKILVIDDEELITELFEAELEEYDVTTANDGQEAWEILKNSAANFDFVFCDISMPRLNGQQLYKQLKNSFPGKEKNFIFITGGVSEPSMQTFLELVGNPTIGKPFHFDLIRKLLANLVKV